eukprot:844802-Prorocentrum_minimum.AAC.1
MCASDASVVLNRWFPEADWQLIYHTADNASATVFQVATTGGGRRGGGPQRGSAEGVRRGGPQR